MARRTAVWRTLPLAAGLALAAVATALPATAADASALSPARQAVTTAAPVEIVPETGFGGYRWHARVREISASWQVPTISPQAGFATASTWIGAQSWNGGPPFIQLGTTEESLGRGEDLYTVFWSDTTVGFHPLTLGVVKPGDELVARMTRIGVRWRLAVTDLTSTRTMATSITYGAGQSFTQGEWLQEDPTDSTITGLDLPYPAMSTVTFGQVLVNDNVPRLGLADGQTLSATGDIYLVPTPLQSDSFSLPAATGPALRYLIDAGRLDRVISAFDVQLVTWSRQTASLRARDIERVVRSYRYFARALRAGDWPAAARTLLLRLASSCDREAAANSTWARSGGLRTSRAYRALLHLYQAGVTITDAARASLGLPEA